MIRSTGDDESSIHRILQLIRVTSIALLGLHFYNCASNAFSDAGFSGVLTDNILSGIRQTGLLAHFLTPKLLSLLLLAITLLGARGKKELSYTLGAALKLGTAGLLLFFGSGLILYIDLPAGHASFAYILLCSTGYLVIIRAGNYFSRIVWRKTGPDIFNRLHESFPQAEGLIENKYSVNLDAVYQYEAQLRPSHINFVNPFSGTLVLGLPGSGKTYSVITPFIKQQIQKGFAMLLYDVKYDDLSRVAYNYFVRHRSRYPGQPAYYNICFDDLSHSHRCNCLAPYTLRDITDAEEAARTVLLGLNMEWIARQDFWAKSAIALVKTLIWFLRRFQDGKYCTWPHVIELAQIEYKELFAVLSADPHLAAQIGPFRTALINGTNEQLDGQVVSATILLARLATPAIYYLMTGNDFTLDLNNPEFPKILTLGGNLQKTGAYGPLISAYINTVCRLANKKGMHPLSIMLEEFSTIVVHTIDKTIATGRANKLAVTVCLQDASQLRLAYGRPFADVVLNTCGNIISGQVTGETAKLLSDRFGRTMQDRESFTINRSDTNTTQSTQLEPVLPVSRISSLSSGEFVGMVADLADQPIELKTFCCRIAMDTQAIQTEEAAYEPLPFVRDVSDEELERTFLAVKADAKRIIRDELERIRNRPDLRHLIIR